MFELFSQAPVWPASRLPYSTVTTQCTMHHISLLISTLPPASALFILCKLTPPVCWTVSLPATVSALSSWTTLGLVESVGTVSPASTSQICGPRQTGPAPSCRRLTNTSQPGRIIRSRLGSAQPRLRPCCWTRRNVSDLCTVRQRVSWSVSRLSYGPPY